MKLALQITARDLPLTEAIESAIRSKAEKLAQFFDRITSCRVVVCAPHRHHHKGKSYHVDIDLRVPGAELVVKREPHTDLYVAIRDAFDAAKRQLQAYVHRIRNDLKQKADQLERAIENFGEPIVVYNPLASRSDTWK